MCSPAFSGDRGASSEPWGGGKVQVEVEELDLREILLVLRRRLRLLIILPLVAAAAAGLVSYYLLTPVYSASTTLWVVEDSSVRLTYNDLMMSRTLTTTYAEVARSRSVMEDVIRRLELVGITPQNLQRRISVTPVKDTEIISITAKDSDPVMTAKLANAVAASVQKQIPKFLRVQNVAVVDPAAVPVTPAAPQPLLVIATAFVLGAMAAVGLAFLLEYMDTRVKTPEDLTRYAELPVLAVIPAFDKKSGRVRDRRPKEAHPQEVVA